MSQHEDSVFIKQFSMVIAALVAFTITIAILAYNLYANVDHGEHPSHAADVSARIQPVGAVYTDQNPAPGSAATTTAPVAEQVPDAGAAAEPAAIDGQAVYASTCFACHDTGAANAPKLEAAAWTERLGKGAEAMTQSAINGIGLMPPKGGRVDLSDEQVSAAVEYMLTRVQE